MHPWGFKKKYPSAFFRTFGCVVHEQYYNTELSYFENIMDSVKNKLTNLKY